MRKINMYIVRILINEELFELSDMDKNTICNAIEHLMSDVETDEIWEERLDCKGETLERYVFDGIIKFMNNNEFTADELWNYEDDCEIFDCIHS